MASINFPRGDLHAFIKHEEEIGRDVFLSLSLIIFTLMCKATFFFAPSSRLWLVSIGQYFEFSRQNLVWIENETFLVTFQIVFLVNLDFVVVD